MSILQKIIGSGALFIDNW